MTEFAGGWYPQEDGKLRYHDGQQWTEHFAPGPRESNPDRSGSAVEQSEAVEDTPVGVVNPLQERMRLHKKARDALEQNLMAGEAVEVIITGLHNQAIAGTNWRAFVYKKGFMAGASFGSELTSWEYRQLVGVQLHMGMLSGAVVLQGPGQAGTSTSYWQSKDSDPLKAPNAIPVSRPWDQAQQGVARLRELIATAHYAERPATGHDETARVSGRPQISDSPAGGGAIATSPDVEGSERLGIQLLRDLAELRDAGILTEQEFEAKKADVLNRL